MLKKNVGKQKFKRDFVVRFRNKIFIFLFSYLFIKKDTALVILAVLLFFFYTVLVSTFSRLDNAWLSVGSVFTATLPVSPYLDSAAIRKVK